MSSEDFLPAAAATALTNDTFLPLGTGEEDEELVTAIFYSRPATIFAAVCAVLFTIIGIGGNLLTVVALLRCPKLRSHATTTFVISLAASDLLFAAINLPLTASRYINQEWRHGDTLCKLFPFFFYGNVAASLMNMVAITINRYVLISCHGNYNTIYSRRNIWAMLFFVWAFSFGMLVPPLAEVWGQLGLDKATFSCTILKKDGKSPKKFLMLFGFLMPCIVIVCCYTAIFVKVKQSRRNVQQHTAAAAGATAASAAPGGNTVPKPKPPNPVQTAQRREDIRLTKMMLLIFLSFLMCFLPLMLVNVADDKVDIPVLHVLASVLAWSSAVINPFIYAFKNRQYQQAFAKAACPLFLRNRNPNPNSSSSSKPKKQLQLAAAAAAAAAADNGAVIPSQQQLAAKEAKEQEMMMQQPCSSSSGGNLTVKTTLTSNNSSSLYCDNVMEEEEEVRSEESLCNTAVKGEKQPGDNTIYYL